ncbi:52 kDa repressor of the inhibitor of the protein kinase-like [Corticium candelabrum]|uniref:52 kDa repressor of the inhibitor of the protein kinase-like n=1 Tax=Corticium candelabrum TaxID=121492 RepID=UPI002E26E5AD|nr:52 kDa repressor of the inhibitor of the protein kinase-like [Corticium candelabrum]
MPRITGRQMYRGNVEMTTTSNYYQVKYTAKFVDHLLSEFLHQVSNDSQMAVKLLHIPPKSLDHVITELAFWEDDLIHLALLKNEVYEWFRLWKDHAANSHKPLPTNLIDALQQCDASIFPCIYQLLIIGCTLPVSSCEAERSFSVLRRIMNYLRSSMDEGKLTGLAHMCMYRDVKIDSKEVVEHFIRHQSTRMFKNSVY